MQRNAWKMTAFRMEYQPSEKLWIFFSFKRQKELGLVHTGRSCDRMEQFGTHFKETGKTMNNRMICLSFEYWKWASSSLEPGFSCCITKWGECIGPNLSILFLPGGIYILKVNIRNTRNMGEICSKSVIKTSERRHWHRSGVFIRQHTQRTSF